MASVQETIERVTEVIEGSDRSMNEVFGEKIRELVEEGAFSADEVGAIAFGVVALVAKVNEWREANGLRRIA